MVMPDLILDEILAKDGKDWSKEEQDFVNAQMKQLGRAALKKRREEIRNG